MVGEAEPGALPKLHPSSARLTVLGAPSASWAAVGGPACSALLAVAHGVQECGLQVSLKVLVLFLWVSTPLWDCWADCSSVSKFLMDLLDVLHGCRPLTFPSTGFQPPRGLASLL